MTLVTRRTIATGAAWSVPVIVVGAAAPQAAASHHEPPITQVNGLGCKEPGESFVVKGDSDFKFGYRFALTSTAGGVVSIVGCTLPGNDSVGFDEDATYAVTKDLTFYITVYSKKSANGAGSLSLILNGEVYQVPVTTTGFPVCER